MKKPAFYYARFVALRLDLAVKALNEALGASDHLTDPLLSSYLSKVAREATVALRRAQAAFEDEKLLSASQLELESAELPETPDPVQAIEHLQEVLRIDAGTEPEPIRRLFHDDEEEGGVEA